MRALAVSLSAVVWLLLTGAGAQVPAPPPDEPYLYIDAETARGRFPRVVNLEKVRQRLVDAGSRGYGVLSMARSSWSMNLLLKHDGVGPRSHRLITHVREGAFLNALNEAGAQGYQVPPEGIKAFEESAQTTWVAVMTKVPDDRRFKYSVVKGTQDGERALADAAGTGRVPKSIVGRMGMSAANTLLFFEETEPPGAAGPAAGRPVYRIIANARTSTTEKDLGEAAAQGFRVIGVSTGLMSVVMARDAGPAPEPTEYRVIATMRIQTGAEELSAAGAEGFRTAGTAVHGSEWVFILHRRPGTSERFGYRAVILQEATANQALRDAEADGYRIAGLFSDIVVLQRP